MSASSSPRLALSKQKQTRTKRKPVKRMTARTRIKPMSAKRRKEQPVIRRVRAACIERDGHCRIAKMASWARAGAGPCEGPSEWAHLPKWRRSLTRGQEAKLRHAVEGSLMLCHRHHAALDAHKFDLAHGDDGAQGLVVVVPYVKGAAA